LQLYSTEVFWSYLCGCAVKAGVTWQGMNKVFVMERSNQARKILGCFQNADAVYFGQIS